MAKHDIHPVTDSVRVLVTKSCFRADVRDRAQVMYVLSWTYTYSHNSWGLDQRCLRDGVYH